jgi:hypothetical protein
LLVETFQQTMPSSRLDRIVSAAGLLPIAPPIVVTIALTIALTIVVTSAFIHGIAPNPILPIVPRLNPGAGDQLPLVRATMGLYLPTISL